MGLLSRQIMHHASEKIKTLTQGMTLHDPTYHLPSLRKVPAMASIVWEIKHGLENGIAPERVSGGTSETYLMKDSQGSPLAIFKPVFNLKDQSMFREFAAYVVDHKNYARVPPVVLASFSHPLFGENRQGSCHLWMADGIRALDRLKSPISPESVRKIAQLDIRILNPDRHSSNLLYEEGTLIPIDHQLALPQMYNYVHFEWLKWPQAQTPFTEEEKAYILAIDAVKDRAVLMEEWNFNFLVGDLYYMATRALQLGVKAGLNASEIGSLFISDKQKKALFYETIRKIVNNPLAEWEEFVQKVERELEAMVHFVNF